MGERERLFPFLEAQEAENNMFLGTLLTRSSPAGLVHLEQDGQILMASLCDGNRTMLAAAPSPIDAPDLCARLAQALPGPFVSLIGPVPITHDMARNYPGASRVADQTIYRLEQVNWPRVSGRMRAVESADHELLCQWLAAFHHEAVPFDPFDEATSRADAWQRTQTHNTFFWIDQGRPVALAALARPTRRGICINAVYTPPEQRGHGYASGLVAALSAEGLNRGKSFCMLYADQNNPISNRIYRRLGYRAVCDACTYRFSEGA